MRSFILLSVAISLGAEIRTPNFQITAPDASVAELIGKWAEHHRRKKAEQWLGREMPAWSDPCRLSVDVTMDQHHGRTEFTFMHGQVAGMNMSISGSLDRLVNSVLPHEVAHTVFAQHCGCPVPRWADEGAAILSESAEEHERHVQMVRQMFEQRKLFRLRLLLPMMEYPAGTDAVMTLYCQGFAVSDYLVKHRDNLTFLSFVVEGQRTKDWDRALQSSYGFRSVEELEESWFRYMKTKRPRTAALPGMGHRSLEITASWLHRQKAS